MERMKSRDNPEAITSRENPHSSWVETNDLSATVGEVASVEWYPFSCSISGRNGMEKD